MAPVNEIGYAPAKHLVKVRKLRTLILLKIAFLIMCDPKLDNVICCLQRI